MRKSSPAWSIRGRKIEKIKEAIPGPGSYSPNSSHFESSPKYGTSRSPRDFKAKDTPGPGAYESFVRSGSPAFSISFRREKKSKNIIPGPGTYTPKYVEPKVIFCMGSSQKLPFKPLPTPGPGSYLNDSPSKRGIGFGSASRMPKIGSSVTPGPGTYELKSTLNGPKFSLSSRLISKALLFPVFFT